MSGFTITITNAGRAALINAQNTGTNAFVLSQVGVSTQHITSNLAALTAFPNERKRLATMAGDVVSDDTLHVTIRDETTDAYAMRAFGLYTSTGILFAVYSQSTPIIEKSAAAMLLLAVDAKLVALTTTQVQFGPVGFTLPPASETVAGITEVATDAETDAGTDNWRYITPRLLKRALAALSGFSLIGHKHDAADITSGVFNVGRIPALGMEKITGLANALAGKAATVHNHTLAQIVGLADALASKASLVHQHHADDIAQGVLAVARIPALGMDKISGLANALAGKAAEIHTHTMAQIVGLADALASKASLVHQHHADDIAQGVLAVARIPALGMEKITGLANALAGKAAEIHTHTMAQIVGLADALAAKANLGATNLFSQPQTITNVSGGAGDHASGKLLTLSNFAPGILLQDITSGARPALISNDNNWLNIWTETDGSGDYDTLVTRLHLGNPTAAQGDNSNGLATTSFVTRAVAPANAAQYRANTGSQPLHPSSVWSAAAIQTITQNPTLEVNLATGLNFTTTMSGNRTLAAPVNAKPGQSGVIQIVQDGVGGKSISFDPAWKFPSGIVPNLTQTANARDVLVFTVIAPGDVVASLLKDIR